MSGKLRGVRQIPGCSSPIYNQRDPALLLRSRPHATDVDQRGRLACPDTTLPISWIRRYRYETLRQIGWPLFRVARYVEWCGHGQELIPVPDEGEWVRLVPIIGTAK